MKQINKKGLVLSVIAAALLLVVGLVLIFLAPNAIESAMGQAGASTSSDLAAVSQFVALVVLEGEICLVFGAINLLFGILSGWYNFANGFLIAIGVIEIVLGVVIFTLVPSILDFVAASKGKQFFFEKKVLEKQQSTAA